MSEILELAGPGSMMLLGGGLALAGALYLLFGWRLHLILLVAAMVVGGGVLGLLSAHVLNVAEWPVALVTGVLCGILAGLVERVGVFMFGGLAGVVLFLDMGRLFREEVAFLFFLLIVFVVAGSLAATFMKPAIVLATAVLGALGLIWGGMLCIETMRENAGKDFALNHPAVMALLFFGLIVLGILFQTRRGQPETPQVEGEAADPS